MKRKFLAWLLTLAMVFNMALPYAAFADELPIDIDASYSADNNNANDNNDANNVEGEPTVGEPSAADVQPAAEPAQDEQPAEANTDSTEYLGEEASPANPGTVAPQSMAGDVMPVADTPATSGSCGATDADNVTWSYDAATTTLTISGTGAMENYKTGAAVLCPWDAYRATTTKVIVAEGVTDIGEAAFYKFAALTDVSVADTVTSVGKSAFEECGLLTNLTLPNAITVIENSAFYDCG